MSSFLDAALEYAKAGLPVIPLVPRNKMPRLRGWREQATTAVDTLRAWWGEQPDSNIGLAVPPGHVVLDVDVHEADGNAALAELEREHGALPETVTARTPSGGRHLWFKLPPGVRVKSTTGVRPGLDFRSHGTQVVAPPSVHPSGGRYQWERWTVEMAVAPQWLVDLVRRPEPAPRAPVLPLPPIASGAAHDGPNDASPERIEWALQHISPDCSYDDWIAVGMALHAWDTAGNGGGHGRALFESWSSGGKKYQATGKHSPGAKWGTFRASTGRALSKLFGLARDAGADMSKAPRAASSYVKRALEAECQLVAAAKGEHRLPALERAAFALGQLVATGDLDSPVARHALARAAGAGLDETEVRAAISRGLEAGAAEPKRPTAPTPAKPQPAAAIASVAATAVASSGGAAPEATSGAIEPARWQSELEWTTTAAGDVKVKNTIANAITILRNDSDWKGVLVWDDFERMPVLLEEPPWHPHDAPDRRLANDSGVREWQDADDVRLASWLARNWRMQQSPHRLRPIIDVVAQARVVHPVRDYLSSLCWDGTPRLRDWLSVYLAADECEYASLVGTWWMLSAVARIFRPGCKADYALILEGAQGIGKSRALRVLGAPWFLETTVDLGSKDSFQQLRGNWIVELAELDSLSRSEASRAKAFFSAQVDTYRPSYGRTTIDQPRQCVFAGTVNHGSYLKDETGGRRFWPVRVYRVEVSALAADRDQLWAEAVHRFKAGEAWWPTTPEHHALLGDQQESRFQRDAWEDVVDEWLRSGRGRFAEALTTSAVLADALGFESSRMDRASQIRVGAVMARLGFERVRRTVGNRREWVYERSKERAG